MGIEDKLLLFSMPLPKSQLDAIHTGRADSSLYLIIGFDTEYQRYPHGNISSLDQVDDLLSRLTVAVDIPLGDS